MKNRTFLDTPLRFAGCFAGACLLLGTGLFAQGDPPNWDDPNSASSPGEEVTSLPMLAGNEGGGFRLSGDFDGLRAVILSVEGSGRVELLPKSGGGYHLLFHGNYEIQLDPAALQAGRATVEFQVRSLLGGGLASFGFFGAQQTTFPLAELYSGFELPLDLFAGLPSFEGHGFGIAALHPRRGFIQGVVQFGNESVTLTQQSRGI